MIIGVILLSVLLVGIVVAGVYLYRTTASWSSTPSGPSGSSGSSTPTGPSGPTGHSAGPSGPTGPSTPTTSTPSWPSGPSSPSGPSGPSAPTGPLPHTGPTASPKDPTVLLVPASGPTDDFRQVIRSTVDVDWWAARAFAVLTDAGVVNMLRAFVPQVTTTSGRVPLAWCLGLVRRYKIVPEGYAGTTFGTAPGDLVNLWSQMWTNAEPTCTDVMAAFQIDPQQQQHVALDEVPAWLLLTSMRNPCPSVPSWCNLVQEKYHVQLQ